MTLVCESIGLSDMVARVNLYDDAAAQALDGILNSMEADGTDWPDCLSALSALDAPTWRDRAARLLGRCATPDLIRQISKAAGSPARGLALEALGYLAVAAPHDVVLLTQVLGGPDDSAAAAAARALGRLAPKHAAAADVLLYATDARSVLRAIPGLMQTKESVTPAREVGRGLRTWALPQSLGH